MLQTRLRDLLSPEALEVVVAAALAHEAADASLNQLPYEQVAQDLSALRKSGKTLKDILGPKGVELLKQGASRPFKPNRELTEKLLDQPILRHALRNMVQKAIQQFLSSIQGMGQGATSGKGLLGSIGRGLAERAEKAAQIGKSLVEGVGGTLYRQLEAQIQPFLSGFMNRSVSLLTESLFEGEQSKLGVEARLQMLEILLSTPLETLLPHLEGTDLKARVELGRAVTHHVLDLTPFQEGVRRYVHLIYAREADATLAELRLRYGLSLLEATPTVLEKLGGQAYAYLSHDPVLAFVERELEAAWEATGR